MKGNNFTTSFSRHLSINNLYTHILRTIEQHLITSTSMPWRVISVTTSQFGFPFVTNSPVRKLNLHFHHHLLHHKSFNSSICLRLRVCYHLYVSLIDVSQIICCFVILSFHHSCILHMRNYMFLLWYNCTSIKWNPSTFLQTNQFLTVHPKTSTSVYRTS